MLQVKGGGIEGETLKVLSTTGGQAVPQDVGSVGSAWSQDKQLWWTGARPGDTLTLGFEVPEAGTYLVFARLTKARDYGIVQLLLDGQQVVDKVDLYAADPAPSGEIALGQQALKAGEHTLEVKILGANQQAEQAFMFGIDYLRLEKSAGETP